MPKKRKTSPNGPACVLGGIVTLFVLSFVLVPAGASHAAPLWPLQVGQEYTYHVWDSDGFSGTDVLRVTGTTMVGSNVYFTFQDPSFLYRSDEDTVFELDEGRLIAWGITAMSVADQDLSITKGSVTVPYGGTYEAYLLTYYDSATAYGWDYFVPGIGMVGGADYDGSYWERWELTSLSPSSVPVPPALLLLGSGLFGLTAAKRMRRK